MTSAQRVRLVSLARTLIAHEPQVDYPLHDVRGALDAATFALTGAQARARLAAGGHLMMDCSAAITCLFKWNSLPDPNGLGYRYEGYTGTMLAHLPHYSNPANARPGAIVIFGPGTGSHACMVLEPDARDPLLFSHGFEGGPLAVRLLDEERFHYPPTTFLSIAGLA